MSRNLSPFAGLRSLLYLLSFLWFCPALCHADTAAAPSGIKLERRTLGSDLRGRVDELGGVYSQITSLYNRLASETAAVEFPRVEFNGIVFALTAADSAISQHLEEQRVDCSKSIHSAELLARHAEMESRYRENMKFILDACRRIRDILASQTEMRRDEAALAELKALVDHIKKTTREKPKITAGTHRAAFPPLQRITDTPVRPAYLSHSLTKQYQVLPEDLAPTIDAQITPRVKKLAADLNRDPVAIYNYVKGQINIESYFGSKKGAEGTLIEKAGNSFDQASLLISLYREIGIPCRYVYGIVSLDEATALNWLNAESVDVLIKRRKGQFSAIGIWDDPKTSRVLVEHVWVEAYLPYFNYKGGLSDDPAQKFWVPLDPSFKRYSYSKAENVVEKLGFSPEEFLGEYFHGQTTEAVDERLLKEIEQLIKSRAPNLAVKDFIWNKKIDFTPVTQLPLQFDSGVKFFSALDDFHEVPDTFRYKISFEIDGVEKSFTACELYNKRVTISFRPATTADENYLASAGGDFLNVSPLFKVRTELKVEGQSVLVCPNAYSMGDKVPYDYRVSFPQRAYLSARKTTLIAGSFYAVSTNMGYVPKETIEERFNILTRNIQNKADRDAVFGEMLYLAAAQYWHWTQTGIRRIGGVFNVEEWHEPSPAMMRADLSVVARQGIPGSMNMNNMVIDVIYAMTQNSRGSSKELFSAFGKLSAINLSVYEHVIFERTFGIQALSTVKILQVAKESGIEIVEITPTNKTEQLLRLEGKIDEDDLEDIRERSNTAGFLYMLVPTSKVTIGDWFGTGWLGFADWGGTVGWGIISGRHHGGSIIYEAPGIKIWSTGLVEISVDPTGKDKNASPVPVTVFSGIPDPFGGGQYMEVSIGQKGAEVPVFSMYIQFEPPKHDQQNTDKAAVTMAGAMGTPTPVAATAAVQESKPKPADKPKGTGSDAKTSLAQDPVNILTGEFFQEEVDLVTPGRMPIVMKRLYKSRSKYSSFLGHAWILGYDNRLAFQGENILLSEPDGSVLEFVRKPGTDEYAPPQEINAGFVNESASGIGGITSPFTKRITYDVGKDVFVYRNGTQQTRKFSACRIPGDTQTIYMLQSIENIQGDSIAFEYSAECRLMRIRNSSGRFVSLHYNSNGYLSEVLSNDGRRVQYFHDAHQDLVGVVNPKGDQTEYAYSTRIENNQTFSTHRLIAAERPGRRRVENEYDAEGRVVRQLQTFGTNATPVPNATFQYQAGRTVVIDFAGLQTIYVFDALKRITQVTDAMGQSVSKTWDDKGNLTAVTDANNHTTTMTYDEHGNILTSTDAKGGVTAYTYDLRFHKVASVIDANGHKTEYTYAGQGNLIEERRFIGTADGRGLTPIQLYSTTTHAYDAHGQRIRTTDPDGNVTTFEYDADGNLVRATDALGSVARYTYDLQGNRASLIDPLGSVTNYEYDVLNRLTAMTNPLGGRTANVYDANGNVLSITNPNGHTTSFTYDYADNQTQISDALGQTIRMEYSQANKRTKATDARGAVTEFFYDNVYRLTEVKDALGNSSKTSYDAAGNVVSATDGRGNITRFVYDELNRRTQVIAALGNISRTEYNAVGNVAERIDPNGNRTVFVYDELNRLTKVTDAAGNSEEYTYNRSGDRLTVKNKRGFVTTFQYDALHRLIKQINADGSVMSYEYDANGRRTAIVDNNGSRTETVYDGNGSVVSIKDALGNATTSTYDRNGNRTSATDANGIVTTFTYDALNRLIARTEGGNVTTRYEYDANRNQTAMIDANGNRTEHAFDLLNRRVSVKDALGAVTLYALDANGNMTAMTNANSRTWRTEFDPLNRAVRRIDPLNHVEVIGYDPNGNVISTTDAKGQIITNEYDVLNRLTKQTSVASTLESYTYDPNSNRLTMTDATGVTTYELDNMDRQIGVHLRPSAVPNSVLTTRFSYDGLGNRRALEYPDGKKVFYDYDKLNRLETVKDNDGAVTCRTTYDAVGNLRTKLYANSTLAEYQYDNLYRVTSVTNKRLNGEIISRFDYQYDAVGNRLRQVETSGGQSNVTVYTYDQTYRLTLENDNTKTISYIYDAVGNRLTKNENAKVTTYTYNTANQLVSENDITYTHDANGNLVLRQSPTSRDEYSYDVRNRLVRVGNDSGFVAYEYNGDGRRISQNKNNSKTIFVYDFADAIYEFGETEPEKPTRTVFGLGGRPIARGPPSGNANFFYSSDALSSITNLTDKNGKEIARYQYSAFGLLTFETGLVEQPYRYIARRYEPQTSLLDLRARWMDPRVGRFISQDVFLGFPYDPRTLHRYTYAFSGPTRYVDLTGYNPKDNSAGTLGGTQKIAGMPPTAPILLAADFRGMEKGGYPRFPSTQKIPQPRDPQLIPANEPTPDPVKETLEPKPGTQQYKDKAIIDALGHIAGGILDLFGKRIVPLFILPPPEMLDPKTRELFYPQYGKRLEA